MSVGATVTQENVWDKCSGEAEGITDNHVNIMVNLFLSHHRECLRLLITTVSFFL